MPLFQLIYISHAKHLLSMPEVQEIVRLSAQKNTALGISGALFCAGRNFLQLLEGEPEKVLPLFERISHDPRHTDVAELLCKQVNRRLFADWAMRLVDLHSNAKLDKMRLDRLVEEFRVNRDTGQYGVEARVLITDFRRQLLEAA